MNKMMIVVFVVGMVLVSSSAEAGPAGQQSRKGQSNPGQGTGVAAAQKYTPEYVRKNLVADKTTMQQVLAKFGRPTDTDMSSNGETWMYRRESEGARGAVKKLSALWREPLV